MLLEAQVFHTTHLEIQQLRQLPQVLHPPVLLGAVLPRVVLQVVAQEAQAAVEAVAWCLIREFE